MKGKLLKIRDLSKSVPENNVEKRNKSKENKRSSWNNNYNNKNGNKVILKNINLDIYEKKTLGLIGPTGSGKTSLLRLINMLDKPSSGKIFYKGEDLYKNKYNLKIRRKIAMVFQKPIVFKGTVFDNVYYGLKIRNIKKEESKEDIGKILEKVGLKGYENQKASTLSGGEIQRVALARALIIKPKILLLDEPTANLDPKSTEKIEKIIEDIQKTEDITIIMATHNLIQGQRLCDKIAIINKSILQVGTTEEIFRKPKNKFVAEFVGMKNIEKGLVTSDKGLSSINTNQINILSSRASNQGKETYIGIRPEDITVNKEKIDTKNNLNQFKGKILGYKDNGALVDLKIDIGKIFSVYLTKKSFLDLEVNIGSDMWIGFKAEDVHLFDID